MHINREAGHCCFPLAPSQGLPLIHITSASGLGGTASSPLPRGSSELPFPRSSLHALRPPPLGHNPILNPSGGNLPFDLVFMRWTASFGYCEIRPWEPNHVVSQPFYSPGRSSISCHTLYLSISSLLYVVLNWLFHTSAFYHRELCRNVDARCSYLSAQPSCLLFL